MEELNKFLVCLRAWMRPLWVLSVVLFSCSTGHAVIGNDDRHLLRFPDETFPEFITSAAALGTGNAYIARTADSHAAFYNPAGLGSLRWFRLHLGSGSAEGNAPMQTASTTQWGTSPYSHFRESLNFESMRKIVTQNRGEVFSNRTQLSPNFSIRFLSFGYLYSRRMRAVLPSNTGPIDDPTTNMEIAYRRDKGPYGSLAIPLFGGIIKFGGTIYSISRKEIYGDVPVLLPDGDTKITIPGKLVRKGKGVFVDGGFRLTLPIRLLPSLAMTVRNATNEPWHDDNEKFPKKDFGPDGIPTDIPQTIDLGFSISPQIAKKIRIHIEGNFKDSGDKYRTHADRRLVGGIEVDIARTVFFRGGYGSRYWSAGVGLKTRFIELEFASYGITTTYSQRYSKEDRRFIGYAAIGF